MCLCYIGMCQNAISKNVPNVCGQERDMVPVKDLVSLHSLSQYQGSSLSHC